MTQKEVLEKLEDNRIKMMQLTKESRERRNEDTPITVHKARMWDHLAAIEDNLVTLNWAVSRLIDPMS